MTLEEQWQKFADTAFKAHSDRPEEQMLRHYLREAFFAGASAAATSGLPAEVYDELLAWSCSPAAYSAEPSVIQ